MIVTLLLVGMTLRANIPNGKTSGTVHTLNPLSTSILDLFTEWSKTYGGELASLAC